MEKQEHQIDTPTTTNWTTREELLLSYAVKRHGFNDWDTVAVEIQSRSSLPQIFTSPHHCKLKYLELKRRFLQINNNHEDNDENNEIDVVCVDADVAVPWLEDLRNMRVEELRREVHRYDDSILNLQMKVKKLEEERERSVEMNENEDVEKPDLQKVNDENGSENDKNERNGERVVVVDVKVLDIVAGESNTGEESDQEKHLSVNESNSTGLKDENNQQAGLNDDTITTKVEEIDPSVSKNPESVIKVVQPAGGDNSCDESSDSVAKRLGLTPEEKENKPVSNINNNNNNSTESRNSETNSERVNTERSDVQSSASLTVRSRRSSGGAGDESVERSFGAMKQISVKSQPLAKIMELIRSHKRGSLFERRLDSQASDKYKNVVRQHMDLLKIQKRLDQGSYSSCTSKFYRDLFLLFNNAIVYFPKSSAEFVAATELQKLVVTEMSKQTQRSDYSPEPSLTPHSQAQSKPDPEKPESLLDSHKSSAPIIVCRKRSSISSKSASDSNKKRGLESEEKKTSTEVKQASGNSNTHVVQEQQSPLNDTDTKDRIITGTRSFRRSNSSLKTSAAPLKKQSNTSTDIVKKETPKIEKNNKKEKEKEQEKEKEVLPSVKKRGAADFLKRIKGSSPLDKLKSAANDTKSTRQNNNTGKKIDSNDGRKEKIILRQKPPTKEDASSSKRNAGGTVKKPAESVPVKRKKEPETSSSKRPPQKRNRR